MLLIHRRCACGCGEITDPGNKYIWGHNSKGMSEETKRKIIFKRKTDGI